MKWINPIFNFIVDHGWWWGILLNCRERSEKLTGHSHCVTHWQALRSLFRVGHAQPPGLWGVGPCFMQQGILVLWLSDIGDNTVESGGQQQTVHNTILQYRKCTTFSLWSSRNFGSYQGRWCFPLPCTSKLGQPRRNAPGVGSIPFWSLHCCRVVVLSCSLAWGTQFHTRKQYPMLGDDGMDWMIFIRSPSEGWSQAL